MVVCTVIEGETQKLTRFLVFDDFHLILVEPEVSRVGFGVVRLVALMEHVAVRVFPFFSDFQRKFDFFIVNLWVL